MAAGETLGALLKKLGVDVAVQGAAVAIVDAVKNGGKDLIERKAKEQREVADHRDEMTMWIQNEFRREDPVAADTIHHELVQIERCVPPWRPGDENWYITRYFGIWKHLKEHPDQVVEYFKLLGHMTPADRRTELQFGHHDPFRQLLRHAGQEIDRFAGHTAAPAVRRLNDWLEGRGIR